MAHPIFRDSPSTDMTKAQERQADLDAQIETFLATGGAIIAYDNSSRPIESGPWRSKSIRPEQQKPEQAAPVKAKPAAPVKAKPVPEEPAQAVETANIDVGGELRSMRKQVAALQRRLNRLSTPAGGRA